MHVQMHMHIPAHKHVATHACRDISVQSPRSAQALSSEPSPLVLPSNLEVSHYIAQAGRVHLEIKSRQALKAKDYLGRKFKVLGTGSWCRSWCLSCGWVLLLDPTYSFAVVRVRMRIRSSDTWSYT